MTRPYSSFSRAQQAERARSRIVDAASRMLLSEGVAAMTIAGLAEEARVSPQTVYNTFGGKAEVVKAVYDVTLAGDEDPTPMSERPAFRAIQAAEDLPAFAVAYAHWVALIYSRVGALLGVLIAHGSAGDPLLEEFVTRINGERRNGSANGIRPLAERGLVEEADLDTVIDAVWALTAPENWFRLVQQRGWSSERYEDWLARVLDAALRMRGAA